MGKENSEDLLKKMIKLLVLYLEELLEFKDIESEQFQYGERVAYTECLEWLQSWEKAEINGLDFEIEERYPL